MKYLIALTLILIVIYSTVQTNNPTNLTNEQRQFICNEEYLN